IDGRVCRAAAAGEQHAVGHDQFTGGGNVRYRCADMVRDDDAGTEDVGRLRHIRVFPRGLFPHGQKYVTLAAFLLFFPVWSRPMKIRSWVGIALLLHMILLTRWTGQAGDDKTELKKPPPFFSRKPEDRKLVKKRGGNEKSEEAVTAGLRWLSRHQLSDGSW